MVINIPKWNECDLICPRCVENELGNIKGKYKKHQHNNDLIVFWCPTCGYLQIIPSKNKYKQQKELNDYFKEYVS